ncbi:hypothetical protein KKH27_05235, partial [bacterium]|nr:hypothetical protein [bacterium]MBU1985225.1 hypothetical protein [bacterium]
MIESPSPFAKPSEGLRIKDHQTIIPRPSTDEIAKFPEQSRALLEKIAAQQEVFLDRGEYKIDTLKGRHFLLAGATGPGLGGAIETAARALAEKEGSVTVLARDLTRSLGYEMGRQMISRAEQAGMGNRFHLINDGIAAEGPNFERIVTALIEAGADEIIYINTIAAAHSGLLPGYPPVYVKDVDEEGLFQWRLAPLSESAIEGTRTIMGRLAVHFPRSLEAAGIKVALTCYIDWRGSLDVLSR